MTMRGWLSRIIRSSVVPLRGWPTTKMGAVLVPFATVVMSGGL
jgi:hypothetical protein